jgi:hypothetical protein
VSAAENINPYTWNSAEANKKVEGVGHKLFIISTVLRSIQQKNKQP